MEKTKKQTKVKSTSKPEKSTVFKHHIQAEATAKHYGFVTFPTLEVEKQDLSKVKNFKDSKKNSFTDKDSVFSFDNLLEEKIAIMRAYTEKQMTELHQPPAIYYSGPIKGNPHHGDKVKPHTFNIDIIGNGKSIADAMVIETAYIILKEHLVEEDTDLLIEINSIGDKDSFARFTREFNHFAKKHTNDMPASFRQTFKKDPFSLFTCKEDSCLMLQEEAPKPMSFFTEQSRDHFREVLEYIESLSLPYMINHSLIGSKHYSSGTIFQIVKINTDKSGKIRREVLAIGERYNTIARKAWGKKEVPAIGATMLIDERGVKTPKKTAKVQETRFYFIQLGYDAKLKSLAIIEMLRVANIPVHQSLSRDKITSQLQAAENMKVPYILILGQKEAIEDSVTVRHISTRVQETVHVTKLIEYLKRLP
jgi:histidyl-tRNA synthetase